MCIVYFLCCIVYFLLCILYLFENMQIKVESNFEQLLISKKYSRSLLNEAFRECIKQGSEYIWTLSQSDFRNSSSIRIWYNDLTSNYATHWHNALEIIIPIDNYYDVEVEGISYHLRPDEILIIPPGKLHQLTAPSSGSRFIYLLDISCLEGLKGFAGIKSLLTAPLFVTKESYSQ